MTMHSMKLSTVVIAAVLGTALMLPAGPASAQRGGARASAKTSVNRPAAQSRSGASAQGASRNTNVNVDSSRTVNVNVDNNNNNWNNSDHPVARVAAVTTAVAVTAAVIGSIVYSPPSGCVTSTVNGVAYQQCGSTWYQPQYVGTDVQYVVVAAP